MFAGAPRRTVWGTIGTAAGGCCAVAVHGGSKQSVVAIANAGLLFIGEPFSRAPYWRCMSIAKRSIAPFVRRRDRVLGSSPS
jgi:hypothetical protein